MKGYLAARPTTFSCLEIIVLVKKAAHNNIFYIFLRNPNMKSQYSGTTQMPCGSQSLIKAPILHSVLSKAELFSGATHFISLKTLCTPLTQNPGLQGLRSPFLPDHLKYLWLDLAAPVKPSTHTLTFWCKLPVWNCTLCWEQGIQASTTA